MELQLQILRACLIANVPLTNVGDLGLQGGPPTENERRGHDQISFSVLATCRLYHTEGWRISCAEKNIIFI